MRAGRRPKNALAPLRVLLGKYENHKDWAPKTSRRVSQALFPFIESLGDRSPNEIWLSDVREYIRQLDTQGYSEKTQIYFLQCIYQFVDWLVAEAQKGTLELPHYIDAVQCSPLLSKPSRELLLNRELNWDLLDE